MVAISLSGSGEGLGRAIARGYSTGNDGKNAGVVIPAQAEIHRRARRRTSLHDSGGRFPDRGRLSRGTNPRQS